MYPAASPGLGPSDSGRRSPSGMARVACRVLHKHEWGIELHVSHSARRTFHSGSRLLGFLFREIAKSKGKATEGVGERWRALGG